MPTKKSNKQQPRCVIIAGPNGAGKTTFAREFLAKLVPIEHFINADLIASGLAPLKPELAAVAAGRVMLAEIERLTAAREELAFESTLSGLTQAKRLQKLKASGYEIQIVFLKIKSVHLALRRIAARIRQGGHNVPAADVRRRFERSWDNFTTIYRPLADKWWVYDNSSTPILLEHGP